MSSFDNLVKRVQMLTEAKAAGYAKQAPVFKDVPKQMKAAGMAASSRDAMIFILQVLSRLDVISPEEFESAKKGQHRERMEKLMSILKNNEETINAKEKDIVEYINNNLDNYTSAAGSDRGRVEKYKETAKKISKEVANIAAGKEADDGLRDILHFVNDTMQDMNIQKAEGDTAETGPVIAAVDATMAQLRKLANEDPDDIPPYVIEDLEEITPKIERMDQLDSFIKQLAAFTKEDQYYEKPVLYFMDAAKKAKQVAAEDGEHAEDYEMEDGEGKYDDGDDVDEKCDYVPCEDGEHGCECEQCPDCMPKEDGEGSVKQQVLDACKEAAGEFAHKNAGMAEGCRLMIDEYVEAGDTEKAEIAKNLHQYFTTQAKHFDEDAEDTTSVEEFRGEEEETEEEEEIVAEATRHTSDNIADIYAGLGNVVIESATWDENGRTSPTDQYLAEKVEEAIEDVYTSQYLTEQKESDSLLVPKSEKRESFKERYQPKTSYQLEELRRYGL